MKDDISAPEPRYFGSALQRRMQRNAHLIWRLLAPSPRYGTEGRLVGIDGPTETDIDDLEALARLQGGALCHYVPRTEEDAFTRGVAKRGLATDRWDQFMGGTDCIDACAAYLRETPAPEGYTLHRITRETPPAVLDRLEATALANGVLPPALDVLCGERRPAVCFILLTPEDAVAACSGAVMRNQPDSAYGTCAWWGMLATRTEDRGKRLSLWLGAQAALFMHETHGAAEFYTGVRRDNAVSRHVCAKLGVTDSAFACVAVVDPEVAGGGRITS